MREGKGDVALASVGEAIAEARALLAAGAVPDPGREAGELYAAIVCGATSAAFLDRDKPVAAVVRERLTLAAERRAAGWPQAYAAGRANFRGHWLAVDQRVLIPRPETEGLVELVLEQTARRQDGKTAGGASDALAGWPSGHLPVCADIGTGSGAIAIALALEPGIGGVIATDVSADALNVALENATALGVKERISFRRGDLLTPLLGELVDVVVSNPPYIATAEWEALEPLVRDYEPRIALDAGVSGLDPYRALVAQARAALAPRGLLALEVDARRAQQTASLAVQAGFEHVEVRDDFFGRPRYVLGCQTERQ